MLIRSQNKDCVVSMEKISALCINKMSPCIPSMCTIDVEYANESIVLGFYESEERAKEVLEKIVEYYSAMKRGHVVVTDSVQYGSKYPYCYDMPAE